MRNPTTATELSKAVAAEKLSVRPVALDVDPDAEFLELLRRRYGFEW